MLAPASQARELELVSSVCSWPRQRCCGNSEDTSHSMSLPRKLGHQFAGYEESWERLAEQMGAAVLSPPASTVSPCLFLDDGLPRGPCIYSFLGCSPTLGVRQVHRAPRSPDDITAVPLALRPASSHFLSLSARHFNQHPLCVRSRSSGARRWLCLLPERRSCPAAPRPHTALAVTESLPAGMGGDPPDL